MGVLSGVKSTEPLVSAIRLALKSSVLSAEQRVVLSKQISISSAGEMSDVPVSLEVLRILSAVRRCDEGCGVLPLAQLLRKSELAFTPTAPKVNTEKSNAAAQRRQLLKLRQEERSYQKMTGNVRASWNQDGIKQEFSSLTQQISIGANIVLAVATAFAIGYVLSGFAVSKPELRMVVGLLCSVAMLFIEGFLYVIRATRKEAQSRRLMKEKEGTGEAAAGVQPTTSAS